MSYSPLNSFALTVTGLVLTGSSGNFGTALLPNSGQHYLVSNLYFSSIASTGIPAGMGFTLSTGSSGIGPVLLSNLSPVLVGANGMQEYTTSQTSWFISSGITVYQTVASVASGLISINIGVTPLF